MKKFFGTIVFYCLFPILLFLGIVWWKESSMFIIDNIKLFLTGKRL